MNPVELSIVYSKSYGASGPSMVIVISFALSCPNIIGSENGIVPKYVELLRYENSHSGPIKL